MTHVHQLEAIMHFMTYKAQILLSVLYIKVQQHAKKHQQNELQQDHSKQMKLYGLSALDFNEWLCLLLHFLKLQQYLQLIFQLRVGIF